MNSSIELTPWRQRQIAMLYRYASLDYMKAVDVLLSRVIEGRPTPALEQSLAAACAAALESQPRMHNDARRWDREMGDILTEMRQLLREDIKARGHGRYRAGGLGHFFNQVGHADAYDAYRSRDEYHVCEYFVRQYSDPAEDVLVEYRRQQPLTDHWFACHLARHLSDQPEVPGFRVRTDITARSGESPPHAGVYVSQDDANAAPQFAWPEKDRGQLTDSSTFNNVGLAALHAIGRDGLWFDQQKMYAFAAEAGIRHPASPQEAISPGSASSALATLAHATRPCDWYYVEIMSGSEQR